MKTNEENIGFLGKFFRGLGSKKTPRVPVVDEDSLDGIVWKCPMLGRKPSGTKDNAQ